MGVKPILFNTEMVQAILEGRKSVTRRVVKPQPEARPVPMSKDSCWPGYFAIQGTEKVIRPPYQTDDILWVRETWNCLPIPEPLRGTSKAYWYKADGAAPEDKWRSPYHMPREAARIFLRVTGVRVERLKEITFQQAMAEGQPRCTGSITICGGFASCLSCEGSIGNARQWFSEVWNSTIKPADLPAYGWAANPWVWVIGFERISKCGEVAE